MLEKYSNKHKIKLGFAPTRRNVFSKEEAGRIKVIIENWLKTTGIEYVNLDFLNDEGLIFSGLDADKVARKFIEEKVDAVFAPHCNFGTEDAVAKLAKRVNKPLLVWGPQDAAPNEDGTRMTDTQCGLFASTKVIQRLGVPYTYITNCRIDDPIFKRGFDNFISAAAIVKSFRSLRIGQISTRPGAFWSVICNEGELLERFGVETVPFTMVDIEQGVNSMLKEDSDELKQVVADIRSRVKHIHISDEELKRVAALKATIRNWADKEELSAIGIQCWSAIQRAIKCNACFVDADLTDDGLPTVCETDIHGAITSIMLQASKFGQSPVFFADLTIRHPENPNAELLWHCGTFPYSLAKDPDRAFLTGNGCPGVGEWEIKGGDITLSRFDGIKGDYYLLMGEGKGVSGPKNKGTYLWAEFKDWPLWEHKFMYGPYIHHCTGIHGKVAAALYEACKYLPGVKADPVEPTAAEIEKYLRG